MRHASSCHATIVTVMLAATGTDPVHEAASAALIMAAGSQGLFGVLWWHC